MKNVTDSTGSVPQHSTAIGKSFGHASVEASHVALSREWRLAVSAEAPQPFQPNAGFGAVRQHFVFELKGNCYLVPDAPVDCILLDFGEDRQMLRWDEVETPNYGINGSGKPQHIAFKKCWKDVNSLALGAISKTSQRSDVPFESPHESWRILPPIQSE